jgi:benzoate-CoA ligase
MTVAVNAKAEAPVPTSVGAIPRNYNFAADILDRNLKAGRADKPAFIDPRGTWTYGQLADRVARFAASLRALGVQREERVLIALLDTIDWPTAFLGCLKAGVVAVPVNTLMTEDDYRFMLADSRARLLVVSEALLPKFAGLIKECPDLAHVMVSGDDAHGHLNFEDAVAEANPEPYTAPTLRDHLSQLVADGHYQLVLDLEDVAFLDSTGLGVLVGGLKRVRAHDGSLTLVCTQERILKVFRITGLTKVFPIHASVDEAVNATE